MTDTLTCPKVRHKSERTARKEAERLNKLDGAHMSAYQCRWCYLVTGKTVWHVGHTPGHLRAERTEQQP